MTLTLLAVAWLLTYLVHSTLLLGAAWALSGTGIVRSPLVRDALWKVALVGGILTATAYSLHPYQPYALHVLLPDVPHGAPAASPPRMESLVPRSLPAPEAPTPRVRVAPVAPGVVAAGWRLASPASPLPNPHSPVPSWPTVILGVWVLGAAGMLASLLVCRLRFSRSLRSRREITQGSLVATLDSLRAAAGVRRKIRLTASGELAGPVAMGASEICLPERALTALSAAEQRAVLAHELGHLVRRDQLWLGLSLACESLLFLQPLNRLARRRIQEAAEFLCDDWAAHRTGGGLTLARCLAEVAAWIEAAPKPAPVSGMAEDRSQLVERVHRLLEGAQPSVRRVRLAVPVAALALSSMAFAAPGVSPPCDGDEPAQASRAPASPAAGPALVQGAPQVWATVRDGRVITFREGFAPRLTGHGHLGIRRGGRSIALGDGQRLLVNGHDARDAEAVQVYESDTLRIVGEDGRTLWQLEPVRLSADQARSWAQASETGAWSLAAVHPSTQARAEAAAELASGRVDSLESQLEEVTDTLDAPDTMDVGAISRAAAELSGRVTRQVSVEIAPQIARIQEMGVRISADLAPRMAELGARITAEVVPAIVEAVCGGGLCDSTAVRVRLHKARIRHRQ